LRDDMHNNMHTTQSLFSQKVSSKLGPCRSTTFGQFASTISQGSEIKEGHSHCACAKRAANSLWRYHRQKSHFKIHLYERDAI